MTSNREETREKYQPPVIEAFTMSSLDDYSRVTAGSGLIWDVAML